MLGAPQSQEEFCSQQHAHQQKFHFTSFLMLEGAMSFKGKHINLLEGKDMFCHLEEEMP